MLIVLTLLLAVMTIVVVNLVLFVVVVYRNPATIIEVLYTQNTERLAPLLVYVASSTFLFVLFDSTLLRRRPAPILTVYDAETTHAGRRLYLLRSYDGR